MEGIDLSFEQKIIIDWNKVVEEVNDTPTGWTQEDTIQYLKDNEDQYIKHYVNGVLIKGW